MRGINNQRMLQSDQNNNLQKYQNEIPVEIHRTTFSMAALVSLVTPITYAGVASHAKVDVIKIPKMWMR